MTPLRFSLYIVIIACLAVSCSDSDESRTPAGPEPTTSVLLPESNLISGCYNWPDEDFSPENPAVMKVLGAFGDPAVDFSLRDIDGTINRLSSLLETRPVFLVLGSFT
jgi:hypothetical protein